MTRGRVNDDIIFWRAHECFEKVSLILGYFCAFLQVFNLRPLGIELPSRLDADRPVVDLDLHLPFLCFQPQQILQVSH